MLVKRILFNSQFNLSSPLTYAQLTLQLNGHGETRPKVTLQHDHLKKKLQLNIMRFTSVWSAPVN